MLPAKFGCEQPIELACKFGRAVLSVVRSQPVRIGQWVGSSLHRPDELGDCLIDRLFIVQFDDCRPTYMSEQTGGVPDCTRQRENRFSSTKVLVNLRWNLVVTRSCLK